MRYGKADQLLRLAVDMQAVRGGIALADIEQKFGVSRRTAQRMRDAVLRVFPQTDEVASDERRKRWQIPSGLLNPLLTVTSEELAGVQAATALLERNNMHEHAELLRTVEQKLRALLRPDAARRIDPDVEALAEAEGMALRPGPRPTVRPQAFEVLRQGIKACRAVAIQYRKRGTPTAERRIVQPHGFLFGHRHYLVALDPQARDDRMRLFSLSQIGGAELLEVGFERRPGFDLTTFAKQSFGVFQEEPRDIVWRFSPEAAATAAEFQFHPDQHTEVLNDGSLVVRFRAGGLLEMAWHAITWGAHLQVIEPPELRTLVASPAAWPVLP